MSISRAAHEWGSKKSPPAPQLPVLHKICLTYYAMMKLDAVIPYLKKILKDDMIFHKRSANFSISKNTDINCIFIYNL